MIKCLLKMILPNFAVIITLISLTSCSSVTNTSSRSHYYPRPSATTAATWDQLQHNSSARLAAMQSTENDLTQKAWIDLALISKRDSVNTVQLAQDIGNWRKQNPSHPANQLLPSDDKLLQLQNGQRPQRIAILLPQQGQFAASGQKLREGFLNAYYNNMAQAGKISVKFYDTSNNENVNALYQQAVAEGADFVIGPLLKNNVAQLRSAGNFKTPILALNYSDAGNGSLPENFYEFGLLPEDEATQIADRAYHAGFARAIIIAPDDARGKRLANAFTARWQTLGGNVADTLSFNAKTDLNTSIASLLQVNPKLHKAQQHRRQDVDVIFLFTQPQEARLIVPLLKFYFAGSLPIYATSSVYSGKPNPTKDVDLNGVTICDIPLNMHIARNGTNDNAQIDRLYAVGQDAYLLSEALQRLQNLPHFPIYGYTGALTLSATQQIHRRLPCSVVQNGHL